LTSCMRVLHTLACIRDKHCLDQGHHLTVRLQL
jgi:hypothetical protein